MLTHICGDEKFIDGVIDAFESLNAGKNRYVIITPHRKLKYIKQKDKVRKYSFDDPKILQHCNNSTAVLFHSFLDEKYYFASAIRKGVKVWWSCWGGDFYNLEVFQKRGYSVYGPLTRASSFLKSPKRSWQARLVDFMGPLHKYYFRLKTGRYPLYHLHEQAIRRVDFVSTVISIEFELLKKILPLRNDVRYLDFSYVPLSRALSNFNDRGVALGRSILIGNSAHPTNNHLEVISRLASDNVKCQCVFPLSYGSEEYAQLIIREGRKQLNDCFVPLTDFMPLKLYIEQVTSCCVMIMNHYRQQAVGNIIVGLHLGMQVYLNQKSPVYTYLKELGAVVFDFETEFDANLLQPLSQEEKSVNRAVLQKVWGDELVKSQIAELVRTLTSENSK